MTNQEYSIKTAGGGKTDWDSQDCVTRVTGILGREPVSVQGGRALFWCPFPGHDGGSDEKPGGTPNLSLNLVGGYWKCFVCGEKGGGPGGLVKRMRAHGFHVDTSGYRNLATAQSNNGKRDLSEAPPPSPSDEAETEEPAEKKYAETAERVKLQRAGLASYAYCVDYLAGRGIELRHAMAMGVGGRYKERERGDKEMPALVFYSGIDETGNALAYQVRYCVDEGQRFTGLGVKAVPFFADKLTSETETLYVAEGHFNALAVSQWSAKQPDGEKIGTVATGGSQVSKKQLQWFTERASTFGKIVLVADNDDAGSKWVQAIGGSVSDGCGDVGVTRPPKGTDADEAIALGTWNPSENVTLFKQSAAQQVDGDTMAVSICTDDANADRLVKRFGNELRWVDEWGWLVFDGRRWARDRRRKRIEYARLSARSIYEEAATAQKGGLKMRAAALMKHAKNSLSRARLDAAIYVSSSDVAAIPDEFDTDTMVLNVRNGTLDLRTFKLLEHDRRDMLTRLTDVDYDKNALAPTWLKFLERVLGGRAEDIEFLQRAVGYSLTGDVSEECLLLLHGSGANGKTTFVNTIKGVMGEYAQEAAPRLLLPGERHPTEIVELDGARFVSSSELPKGKALSDSKLKRMASTETLRGRGMGENHREFKQTHKLWLATNHLPPVPFDDEAMWRRLRPVPFDVRIPVGEQDRKLELKLREEYPGVLAWAVEGCRAWQRDGLGMSPASERALANYRKQMDSVRPFVKQFIKKDAEKRTHMPPMFKRYQEFCKDEQIANTLKASEFYEQVIDKTSAQRVRYHGRDYMKGIMMIADAPPAFMEEPS